MISVTDETKTAWASDGYFKHIKVEFPNLSLTYTNDDIVADAFKLTQTLAGSNFTIGGCNAACCEVEIANIDKTFTGQAIKVSLQAGDTEEIPVFYGFVYSVKKGGYESTRKVTAYDWLYTAQSIDVTSWYDTHNAVNATTLIEDFFSTAVSGVELGTMPDLTSKEIEFSGKESGDYMPDSLTAAEFLQYFCQVYGLFGRMAPDGKFEIISIGVVAAKGYYTAPYFKSFEAEDYNCGNYDGVIITNNDDTDYTASEAAEEEAGVRHYGACTNNPLVIRANKFMNQWTLRKTAAAQYIYEALNGFKYVPYTSSVMALPFLQTGDWVRYDDNGETRYGLILERTISGIQNCFDTFRAEGTELAAQAQISMKVLFQMANNNAIKLAGSGGGDVSNKMDKANPVGTGSMSMNRKANTTVGANSDTFGYDCEASGALSLAEGYATVASGAYAHAEGNTTKATGFSSHAENGNTTASANYSHAEGYRSTASGENSHSEGANTTASGANSHTEGANTIASAEEAHAEGGSTNAVGVFSHAEGQGTTASGEASHAEGESTYAVGKYSHAEGYSGSSSYGAMGDYSHAEGCYTLASGEYAHSEGINSQAKGAYSHAEGSGTYAYTYGDHAEGLGCKAGVEGSTSSSVTPNHAEGFYTTANGKYSHSEGYQTKATGDTSHAEGESCTASGKDSHAEGYYTTASGTSAHSEGNYTEASGSFAHAEGDHCKALNGFGNHAEGYSTTANATGGGCHAEGMNTTASNTDSHAEGYGTTASGSQSHAEGYNTTASGSASHSGGKYTSASYDSQTAIGEYNNSKSGDLFEIGNGTSSARSNILEVSKTAMTVNGEITAVVSDTTHTLSSKITESDANTLIATAIGQLTYLTKQVATQEEIAGYIADPTTASFNVIYLLKDDSASGTDKYLEYQRLGDDTSSSFVCTGDTSTDLSDYAKTEDIPTKTSELENDGDGTKPFLTEHQSLEGYAKTADLAVVATSGSYNDLDDKPTIPDAVSVSQIETSGTHIADITIGDTTTEIYAPEGGGSDLPLSIVDGKLCITYEYEEE